MQKNPVTELLAQQLHREYRAAEKALRTTDEVGHYPYFKHDHGWEGCHRKKYFQQHASRLIAHADAINPITLSAAEQALAATVLIRRLSVEGKLKVLQLSHKQRADGAATRAHAVVCKNPPNCPGNC